MIINVFERTFYSKTIFQTVIIAIVLILLLGVCAYETIIFFTEHVMQGRRPWLYWSFLFLYVVYGFSEGIYIGQTARFRNQMEENIKVVEEMRLGLKEIRKTFEKIHNGNN